MAVPYLPSKNSNPNFWRTSLRLPARNHPHQKCFLSPIASNPRPHKAPILGAPIEEHAVSRVVANSRGGTSQHNLSNESGMQIRVQESCGPIRAISYAISLISPGQLSFVDITDYMTRSPGQKARVDETARGGPGGKGKPR